MTKTHKSNLAKTAIYLLKKAKDEKFDMFTFSRVRGGSISPIEVVSEYNKCGTTCCFAGHAPMALGNPSGEINTWHKYILNVFGVSCETGDWQFLFCSYWGNSRKQAAARAVVFLESGTPEDYLLRDKFLPHSTIKQLIERLKPFIIKDK